MKQRATNKEIIQKRAFETREKILRSALEIYAQKGYHKATVDEIAEYAEASTGVAYRYFKNKKELLLAALEYGFSMIKELAGVKVTDVFGRDLEKALIAFERIHIEYRDIHEELEGLRHSDPDVGRLYENFAKNAITEVFQALPMEIQKKPNALENLYIAIGIMENYCHSYMHQTMSEDQLLYMRRKTVELTENLLKGQ
ncbi:MAG: TetR/AcrR family transcriptional regulator [Acetatifactor sp.]|nr:TetR/AcrR family transcriptional regulator [Acetatifactor sp.]